MLSSTFGTFVRYWIQINSKLIRYALTRNMISPMPSAPLTTLLLQSIRAIVAGPIIPKQVWGNHEPRRKTKEELTRSGKLPTCIWRLAIASRPVTPSLLQRQWSWKSIQKIIPYTNSFKALKKIEKGKRWQINSLYNQRGNQSTAGSLQGTNYKELHPAEDDSSSSTETSSSSS